MSVGVFSVCMLNLLCIVLLLCQLFLGTNLFYISSMCFVYILYNYVYLCVDGVLSICLMITSLLIHLKYALLASSHLKKVKLI